MYHKYKYTKNTDMIMQIDKYHKYKDKQTKTGAIIHTDKYKYKIDKKLFFNVT